MGNLLIQIIRWFTLSAVPEERVREFFRVGAHSTYVLLPILGAICMILGLHTQIVGFYVAAAVLSFIPVVLMDIARRFSADVPLIGEATESTINTLATPHTWLGILNFWFIFLQPSTEYIIQAYLAILGVGLFIVASGRWHKEPKWYKPLTRASLFLPALFAVGQLVMDRFWPEEMIALKTSVGVNRMEATRSQHGQRFDQNIQRATESGTGYRIEDGWFGDDETPVAVRLNELLWKTETQHERRPDGLYYAEFRRQRADRSMAPDPDNTVWYPESMVSAAGSVETRKETLPVNTVFYPDNNGMPSNRKMYLQRPQTAEVTGNAHYVDGAPIYFARIHDSGQMYKVWVKI